MEGLFVVACSLPDVDVDSNRRVASYTFIHSLTYYCSLSVVAAEEVSTTTPT